MHPAPKLRSETRRWLKTLSSRRNSKLYGYLRDLRTQDFGEEQGNFVSLEQGRASKQQNNPSTQAWDDSEMK